MYPQHIYRFTALEVGISNAAYDYVSADENDEGNQTPFPYRMINWKTSL